MKTPPILALATLAACDPDQPDPGDGGQFGEETDTGCQVVAEIELDIDEDAGWGVRPQDLLDAAEGEHAATVDWADDTAAALSVGVSSGARPRLLDYEYVDDGSGIEPDIYCADVLAVDVSLTLSTDDGRLAESLAATLQAAEGEAMASALVELDGLSGSLDPASFSAESFDEVWADLSMVFDGAGVSGELWGYGEARSGSGPDGSVSLTRFEIGRF